MVIVPSAKPFLMYGLTEAFRSTYLPPEEVDRRPDSIGKAIPNAEILVLREDGSECAPDEPGELVHRGALVGMGYWNDAEKTAERYRLLPAQSPGRQAGLQLPEYAVFSGDTVRRDAEGFLWTGLYAGDRLARFTPDGRLDTTVPMPTSNLTKLCFGGADMKTVYVTSARAGLSPEKLAAQPLAGSLLAFESPVAGFAATRVKLA